MWRWFAIGNDGFWGRQCGSGGYGGGLYTVSELKARSLSSRNTLGDTTHHSSNHKCYMGHNWVGLRKAMVVWRMIWWMVYAKMPKCQIINGVKWCWNLSRWMGVSIATQRAKERENRTPDVKVMVKTINQPRLKLGGAVVPLEVLSGSTAQRGRSTLVSGFFADRLGAQFWGGNG